MPANRLLLVDADGDIAEAVAVAAAAALRQGVDSFKPTLLLLDLEAATAEGVQLLGVAAQARSTRIAILAEAGNNLAEAAGRLSQEHRFDLVATLMKPLQLAELRALLDRTALDEVGYEEATIAAAIANRELFLLYQPKIALRDGRVVGYEGLVRWRH